jgi:hypothetical protein
MHGQVEKVFSRGLKSVYFFRSVAARLNVLQRNSSVRQRSFSPQNSNIQQNSAALCEGMASAVPKIPQNQDEALVPTNLSCALRSNHPSLARRLIARIEILPAALLLGTLMSASLAAQDAEPPGEQIPNQQDTAQPTTLDRTAAMLHGVVRNASTGEGLPRTLVRIEGDANTGVLTDGDGRFEIPNLSVGPQTVEVRKPGFRDAAGGNADPTQGDLGASTHSVLIAAQMRDVVFTLAPTGAIRGTVELSTGDAAESVTVQLAQRTVQDGRFVWRQAGNTRTRSDGSYRFGLLADGDYAISTAPSMESDLDRAPGGVGQRRGYPSAYYADAREPSGASRIHVANGQDTQANLTLTVEPFYTVTAAVVFPQAGRAGASVSTAVLDSAGRPLLYAVQFDEESQSVQTELPDGNYTLLISSVPQFIMGRPGAGNRSGVVLVGTVDISVAGRAVPNLRVVLSAIRPNPVQLTVQRNAASHTSAKTIVVTAAHAEGWVDDSMISDFANGAVPGPLEAAYLRPGSYWVHTHLDRGLCEAAFTAGGANLAREPLVMALSGSAAPLELTVRDDCASLQLNLPESADSISAGEEPFYTVYVVPDFDSTTDVQPLTLRASTGGAATLEGLTPGNYHVYTFAGVARLAYRNRQAMVALKNAGQAITLGPGASANLVVEVPQR